MKPLIKTLSFLLCSLLVTACAGSAPDYGLRTTGGPDQEDKLTTLIGLAAGQVSGVDPTRIVVPYCSSRVGKPASGWAIDEGNWCVIRCDRGGLTQARWVQAENGKRCLAAASDTSASTIETDFKWADLVLQEQTVFDGFSRSFISDTEWHCREFNYLIDPDTRKGFWNEAPGGAVVYRFHRDGKLVTGPSMGLMKLSGSWRVGAGDQVFFNSTPVFRNSIDYGGGRFDDFSSTTNKKVCRYLREADQPL